MDAEQIPYGKLVRDDVRGRLENEGKKFNGFTLTDPAVINLVLLSKLVEEAGEVATAVTREELLDELAGLEIVLRKVRKMNGIRRHELNNLVTERIASRKTFEGNFFLVSAPAPPDRRTTNHARNYRVTGITEGGVEKSHDFTATSDLLAEQIARIFTHVLGIKNPTLSSSWKL